MELCDKDMNCLGGLEGFFRNNAQVSEKTEEGDWKKIADGRIFA